MAQASPLNIHRTDQNEAAADTSLRSGPALINAAPARPSPEEIDESARLFLIAKDSVERAKTDLANFEQECIDMVMNYGVVPPHAEKSRRLNGRYAELTVTKGDTLTINDERVEVLREALEANGQSEFFKKLFSLRSRYEVVEGAESALKSQSLGKRLSERVLNLWGRCISVKAKKPALKVTMADPIAPAKKTRKKKGGAQ